MGINFDELRRPFSDEEVQWRVDSVMKWQSGPHVRLLAYIDARAAMERLDRACTPAGWSDAYEPGPQGGVMCVLSVKVGDEWISKSDVAENTQIEAVKGGMARNLYAIGDTVVPVVDRRPGERGVKVYSKRDGIKGWAQAPHIKVGDAVPLPAQPEPAQPSRPQRANGSAQPQPEPSRLDHGREAERDGVAGVLPACPSCKVAGVVNEDKRSDRSPDYLCAQGCKREGTDYDLGYWAASEKQQRMAHVVLGKYAQAHDVAKEVALDELGRALGVPTSVAEWSQPMCSSIIDKLDEANKAGKPISEPAQPGPSDVPTEEPDSTFEEDDIPF